MEHELAGREATEAKLEETALALMQEHGVLAGLNLSDVAERAGVNRGLVYHYYGSRGTLLRRALQRRTDAQLRRSDADRGLPFQQRMREFLRASIDNAAGVQLFTLLVLDGTAGLRTMPRRRQSQRDLARDIAEHLVDPGVDRTALHALIPATVYGYIAYREAFAAELGVPLAKLDKRVTDLFERLLTSLRPDGPGPTHDPEEP